MQSFLFLLFLATACGHTIRTGAGPLVDHRGKPGLVASFEVGTHLVSAKQAAEPFGFRLETSATEDGVQGLVGVAFGLNIPAGGFRDDGKRSWGGRLAMAAGGLFDTTDATALGVRGGLGLMRGRTRRDGSDGGGCLGSHEKSRTCYAWDRYRFSQNGVELGARFRIVDEDDDARLDGWFLSAEFVHEHGTLSDLGL